MVSLEYNQSHTFENAFIVLKRRLPIRQSAGGKQPPGRGQMTEEMNDGSEFLCWTIE